VIILGNKAKRKAFIMNRNLFKLFVFVLFAAAALIGCGGGSDSPQPQPQSDAEPPPDVIGQDQDLPDAADETDTNVDPPDADASPDADAEVGQDADAADDSSDASDTSDSDADASDEADVQPDVDAGDEPDVDVDADADDEPEVGSDADASDSSDAADTADAETGTDAADAQSEPEPPPPEVCNNNIDDDYDGLKDCFDPDCASASNCQPPACDGVNDIAESFDCSLGAIRNCSTNQKLGQQTCEGPDCTYDTCTVLNPEVCNDGFDNDLDGKVDCVDPLCASAANCQCISGAYMGDPCTGVPIGTLDCSKTRGCNCWGFWDYASDPSRFNCPYPEGNHCNDGVDNDQDGKIDCHDLDCHDTPPCKEVCNDTVDNDLDSLTDCFDPDCNASPYCILDPCDGIDNNGINGADEGFECVGSPNNVQQCDIECNGATIVGARECDTNTCTWGTCDKPSTETSCTDGIDNDCDGWIDCRDQDCWDTTACQHNWGPVCSPIPNGAAYTCGSPVQTIAPTSDSDEFGGCALGQDNQFTFIGHAASNISLFHYTAGSWSNVALSPLGGSPYIATDISCLKADNSVFVVYKGIDQEGVFARWNGTTMVRLAAQVTGDSILGPLCGIDSNHVYFIGHASYDWNDMRLYEWDGSSLTAHAMPSFGTNYLTFDRMYCASPTSVYGAGMLYNANEAHAALLHWDGTSWAVVQTPAGSYGFSDISGTSDCDIMAVGDSLSGQSHIGLTFQKNGTAWQARYYPELEWVRSVAKVAPHKYILGGLQQYGEWLPARIGTDNGDFSISWYEPGPGFFDPKKSWSVPNSTKMTTAGDGFSTQGPAIVELDCQ